MLRGVCPPGPPSFRSIEHVPRRPYPPVQTGEGSLQADVTHRKGVRFAQLAHGGRKPPDVAPLVWHVASHWRDARGACA
jgi:hypothetical protein